MSVTVLYGNPDSDASRHPPILLSPPQTRRATAGQVLAPRWPAMRCQTDANSPVRGRAAAQVDSPSKLKERLGWVRLTLATWRVRLDTRGEAGELVVNNKARAATENGTGRHQHRLSPHSTSSFFDEYKLLDPTSLAFFGGLATTGCILDPT
jgi:hypothetical protein